MSNYSDSKFDLTDANTSWQKTFELIPEASTVLDIGCSSGTFGERLIKEKKCIVDGIDINDGDLKLAQNVLRHTYKINIEQDVLDIDHQYDVIFMGDVIEHLANPIPTLKKVRKLLKPSGALVFSIPNLLHMSMRLMFLKGEIQYGKTGLLDETHLHFYNSKEVHRVLNVAGFRIKSFDYTVNDIPEDVLKLELKKLGLSTSPEFLKHSHSLDAGAYQFIGLATPSKPKEQELPLVSPLNIIDKYHKKLQTDYRDNVARIMADKAKILAEKETILTENARLNKKLSVLIKEFAKKLARKTLYKLSGRA